MNGTKKSCVLNNRICAQNNIMDYKQWRIELVTAFFNVFVTPKSKWEHNNWRSRHVNYMSNYKYYTPKRKEREKKEKATSKWRHLNANSITLKFMLSNSNYTYFFSAVIFFRWSFRYEHLMWSAYYIADGNCTISDD